VSSPVYNGRELLSEAGHRRIRCVHSCALRSFRSRWQQRTKPSEKERFWRSSILLDHAVGQELSCDQVNEDGFTAA
jgi:hypothetical protein